MATHVLTAKPRESVWSAADTCIRSPQRLPAASVRHLLCAASASERSDPRLAAVNGVHTFRLPRNRGVGRCGQAAGGGSRAPAASRDQLVINGSKCNRLDRAGRARVSAISRGLAGASSEQQRRHNAHHDRHDRDWAPPMLPEGAETVGALAPGPENASEREERADRISNAAHATILGVAGRQSRVGRHCLAHIERGPLRHRGESSLPQLWSVTSQ